MKEPQQRRLGEVPGEERTGDPSDEHIELRDFRPEDERRIVETLAAAFPHGWHGNAFWRWKHVQRPGFKPSEVTTVISGEEMVACFHGATLPLKLEPGLIVDVSFDGDFAVMPGRRGKNIPLRAHDLMDRRLLEAGVTLRGGFTSKILNERFYSKFGYRFVPTSTLHFRKIIGLRPLKQKIEALGERILERGKVRETLARRPMVINLQIETLPAFHVAMTAEAFTAKPGTLDKAEMSIQAPYAVIVSLTMGRWKFVRSVISSLLSFRLRARGLLRMSGQLLALARAFIRKD